MKLRKRRRESEAPTERAVSYFSQITVLHSDLLQFEVRNITRGSQVENSFIVHTARWKEEKLRFSVKKKVVEIDELASTGEKFLFHSIRNIYHVENYCQKLSILLSVDGSLYFLSISYEDTAKVDQFELLTQICDSFLRTEFILVDGPAILSFCSNRNGLIELHTKDSTLKLWKSRLLLLELQPVEPHDVSIEECVWENSCEGSDEEYQLHYQPIGTLCTLLAVRSKSSNVLSRFSILRLEGKKRSCEFHSCLPWSFAHEVVRRKQPTAICFVESDFDPFNCYVGAQDKIFLLSSTLDSHLVLSTKGVVTGLLHAELDDDAGALIAVIPSKRGIDVQLISRALLKHQSVITFEYIREVFIGDFANTGCFQLCLVPFEVPNENQTLESINKYLAITNGIKVWGNGQNATLSSDVIDILDLLHLGNNLTHNKKKEIKRLSISQASFDQMDRHRLLRCKEVTNGLQKKLQELHQHTSSIQNSQLMKKCLLSAGERVLDRVSAFSSEGENEEIMENVVFRDYFVRDLVDPFDVPASLPESDKSTEINYDKYRSMLSLPIPVKIYTVRSIKHKYSPISRILMVETVLYASETIQDAHISLVNYFGTMSCTSDILCVVKPKECRSIYLSGKIPSHFHSLKQLQFDVFLHFTIAATKSVKQSKFVGSISLSANELLGTSVCNISPLNSLKLQVDRISNTLKQSCLSLNELKNEILRKSNELECSHPSVCASALGKCGANIRELISLAPSIYGSERLEKQIRQLNETLKQFSVSNEWIPDHWYSIKLFLSSNTRDLTCLKKSVEEIQGVGFGCRFQYCLSAAAVIKFSFRDASTLFLLMKVLTDSIPNEVTIAPFVDVGCLLELSRAFLRTFEHSCSDDHAMVHLLMNFGESKFHLMAMPKQG